MERVCISLLETDAHAGWKFRQRVGKGTIFVPAEQCCGRVILFQKFGNARMQGLACGGMFPSQRTTGITSDDRGTAHCHIYNASVSALHCFLSNILGQGSTYIEF